MKRNAKKLRRALTITFALLASGLGLAGILASSYTLRAQNLQSSSSDKPKTNAASTDKPASTKPTSSNSASTADALSTQDSKTRTSTSSAKTQKPRENGAGMVWVNTESGVYHKPGTRWYGKTKHGKYMLETDAIKAGYKPAKR